MVHTPVPLVDLRAQHAALRAEIEPAVAAVLERGDFILGAAVARFERAFAEFVGAAHVVGVGNGTDAMEIALRAAGIGPGDEVLVPANTFVATAIGVIRAGGRPVYVDCDERTMLVDLDAAAKVVGPRVRALVPVHLAGRLVDPDTLRSFARAHPVRIVEDAAQAHGAQDHAGRAGSIGVAAAFSFYPGKNLGAFGDAGAVTTPDGRLAELVRQLRDHGQRRKYEHLRLGCNARLDALQAAVLRVKLPHLESWNAARRRIAARYHELLRDTDYRTPAPLVSGEDHVYHLYVVRHGNRPAVLRTLHENGIGFGLHYPVPIHRTPAYAGLGWGPGSCPVAERQAEEVLSLPMYPELEDAHIERVCEVLTQAACVGG
jgi:dTDP-4-amino-4,6-dideoxygalactose transaminase